MQSLKSLPYIKSLLREGKHSQALILVDRYLEVLAPQLKDSMSSFLQVSPEDSLILSKIYLLLEDFPKCVETALKAKHLLHTLNSFYFQSIFFRMMDQLVINSKSSIANNELRDFVLSHIQNENLDDSLLGFLCEIKETEMLKKHIVSLSKSQINCADVLDHLLDSSNEEFLELFIECSCENPHFLEYTIDAYIYKMKIVELCDLILHLPWDRIYLACFYIEETYPTIIITGGLLDEFKNAVNRRLNGKDNKNSETDFENIIVFCQNAEFILSGEWKTEIMSNFMLNNSKTSFKFLENMTKARAPYISLCNCIMNAYTTNDTLYRNNKGMLSGREWVRFIEYSCIGMVHQGNADGFEILKEILPSYESSSSGEPGSLMALGSIYTGKADNDVNDFLLAFLENNNDEIIYGACMGLGLNLLETEDISVAEKIKSLFSLDNTIAQESALYALGLIFASSEDEEMFKYISTINEKSDFPRVKMVAAVAMSLISIMGTCDQAFSLIQSNDSTRRIAGLLCLGTSYIATGNLSIIEKILPFINDGEDDAKRAAVIAISLVGYWDKNIKSSVLIPLAQNHNSTVRSTVAMTLGLFYSGLGDTEICDVLEALLYDSNDIVRQSACIGCGFALIQSNPDINHNYKRILDRLNQFITSKEESQCVKIGASIGRSIAEVGGKSAVFSLKNHIGKLDTKKIVGCMLFLHSYYWYPLLSCMYLMILPTPLFFYDEYLEHTEDVLQNSNKYYDFLVKLPEIRRSRRFKAKDKLPIDVVDKKTDAPAGLRSGDRLCYREMFEKLMDSGIIFKNK